MGRVIVVMAMVAWAVPARATPEGDAAQRFERGRDEYQRGDYEHAYEDFKQAYLLSSRPALIYNMARALEGLKRYGEAASALRSYLRASVDDPERAQIEQHIRELDEAQRIQSSGALALSPGPLRSESPPVGERPHRKRNIAIAIAVGSVAVAGLAIGLGVGLGTRGPGYSNADVGPLKSTP